MADLSSLVATRYGHAPAAGSLGSIAANETLTTILSHKSVRSFLPDRALPDGTLNVLLAAAQSAPTSCNMQTWSVVAVEDVGRKAQLATLSGNQDFIRQAPLFLVFVADLHRGEVVAAASQEGEKKGSPALDYAEMFVMASLDAALAAQNAVVAAASLGLATCYAGAARNQARELATLLGLPPRTIGLFGLAVGVPDPAVTATTMPKPRLPAAELLHREQWNDGAQAKHISEYDATFAAFNASQQRCDMPAWSVKTTERLGSIEAMHGRHELGEILRERGFPLK